MNRRLEAHHGGKFSILLLMELFHLILEGPHFLYVAYCCLPMRLVLAKKCLKLGLLQLEAGEILGNLLREEAIFVLLTEHVVLDGLANLFQHEENSLKFLIDARLHVLEASKFAIDLLKKFGL